MFRFLCPLGQLGGEEYNATPKRHTRKEVSKEREEGRKLRRGRRAKRKAEGKARKESKGKFNLVVKENTFHNKRHDS